MIKQDENFINDIEPIDINDVEPIELDNSESKSEEKDEVDDDNPIINFVKKDKYIDIHDGYLIVKLQKPRKNKGGDLIKEVKIREPNLLDSRRVMKRDYSSDIERTLALTVQLSGLEEGFFNGLVFEDSDRVWAATQYFLLVRPMSREIIRKMK